MSDSKTTTDHQEIREWVENRKGRPAVVSGTEENEIPAGMLRIMFSEDSENGLKPISWETFFKTFEDRNLAFLYQEKTSNNSESRFFKFVRRS
jgi:hypothetical protein